VKLSEAVGIRVRHLQGERIDPLEAQRAIEVIQAAPRAVGRPPKSDAQKVLELLKASHTPLSAALLAAQLEMSPRTIYRYVKELRDAGHAVEGKASAGLWLEADSDERTTA
jgi:biotin operon repressor